jgi:hypothetical protein
MCDEASAAHDGKHGEEAKDGGREKTWDRGTGMMRPRMGCTEDRERVEVLKTMIGRAVGR